MAAVIIWAGLSLAAGVYAERLGRSALWVVTALFLSPLVAFALLFALGNKARAANQDRTPCPVCAEDIRPEAIVCPHCRSDLAKPGPADRLIPRRRF